MNRRGPQHGDRLVTVRRGLTLLEVMFAVILLGLVAVSVSSTVTMLARLQTDDRQRLGAYELASRKILEYLDDKSSIGSPALPQEIYGFRYRWDLREEPVRMSMKNSEAAARTQAVLSPERYRQVSVRVWSVDERASRGGSLAVPGEQVASLSRVFDPIAVLMFRNPDSRDNGIKNGEALPEFIRILMGQAQSPNAKPPAAWPGGGGLQ